MDTQDNAKGIPEEDLEKISGGAGGGAVGDCQGADCPKCGSTNTHAWKETAGMHWEYHWTCSDCGNQWLQFI